MDFWDRLFDNEYKRRADIDSLRKTARRQGIARYRDREQMDAQEQRIERLEEHVGELALLCRTLLTVLRENESIKPEHFEKVMNEIDAEDGVVDGMITPERKPDDPTEPPEIKAW